MNNHEDDTIKCDCSHWESESRISIMRLYDIVVREFVDQVVCAHCAIELVGVPHSVIN